MLANSLQNAREWPSTLPPPWLAFSTHEMPVHMMRLRTSFCPTLQETEGVQTITNELLDAADAAADDGLPRSGYTLLGVDSCTSLQHPPTAPRSPRTRRHAA